MGVWHSVKYWTSVVLYHLLSELLLFALGALSEELYLVLPCFSTASGGLISLMALFIDLSMLLFENPVSLLFRKAPLNR